ncbi:mitogen-activated protein kinase kinase kinase YODA isoform X2 [Spinacia oleracea]|uniref:mitogen-activated protein kinase kinase kinase n=2 Tax=Spinacia oleracea TaxID=3562 RepID=A0A9R0JS72_SPIOL|nr:mitogen-activated protein kinase kinase kinase YODA-like isoform X2 [Spinacia oleracea]
MNPSFKSKISCGGSEVESLSSFFQFEKPHPFSLSSSIVTRWFRTLRYMSGEMSTRPVSCWEKGRLIGRGTFGLVYVGINSETGETCAMKEVTFSHQFRQEITLLSRLRHPNIVHYRDSEIVNNNLYICLEYVSGGSICKILRENGELGESAIRSYTQQILSGLAYLHSENTAHSDIRGANILVDPSGQVKLADFGIAKHIRGQLHPISFRGNAYWMAPEVIRDSNGCNLAADIWSLGCTVIEMATTQPPWSQYEQVAAVFKIATSNELPVVPDNLSEEGKDFVQQCLQRNPQDRPTAIQLLGHPFLRNAASSSSESFLINLDPH